MPQLRPYQLTAIDRCMSFLESENRFCYNAMQQRLGKTPVSIAIADIIQAKYVRVLSPKSVRLNWYREFQTWSSQRRSLIIDTFHGTRNLHKQLVETKNKWDRCDLLIVDEAQAVKNLESTITQIVYKKLIPRSRYTLFLSGTPVTHSVVDLWPAVARFVPNEELLKYGITTKESFADFFCVAFSGPFGWSYRGLRNGDILSKLIRKYFYFRQTRKEVAPELPKKQFQLITLDPEFGVSYTPEEWKMHRRSIGAGRVRSENQDAGIKKMPAIIEHVENRLEDGPTILYAYHRLVVEGYFKKLQKYKPVMVHGDVPEQKRFQAFEDFQNGKTNLFIGQVTAAGTGIKLSRGKVIVMGELTYSAADLSQVSDRAVDMEDTEPVCVDLFQAEGSPDEGMMDVIIDKAKVIAEVVEN